MRPFTEDFIGILRPQSTVNILTVFIANRPQLRVEYEKDSYVRVEVEEQEVDSIDTSESDSIKINNGDSGRRK